MLPHLVVAYQLWRELVEGNEIAAFHGTLMVDQGLFTEHIFLGVQQIEPHLLDRFLKALEDHGAGGLENAVGRVRNTQAQGGFAAQASEVDVLKVLHWLTSRSHPRRKSALSSASILRAIGLVRSSMCSPERMLQRMVESPRPRMDSMVAHMG